MCQILFAVRQRRKPGPADQDGRPARPDVAHQDLARPGHPLGTLVPPREGMDNIYNTEIGKSLFPRLRDSSLWAGGESCNLGKRL